MNNTRKAVCLNWPKRTALREKQELIHAEKFAGKCAAAIAPNSGTHPHQPKRMVGRMQERDLSQTRQARPSYNGMESGGHSRTVGAPFQSRRKNRIAGLPVLA